MKKSTYFVKAISTYLPIISLWLFATFLIAYNALNVYNVFSAVKTGEVLEATVKSAKIITEGSSRHKMRYILVEASFKDENGEEVIAKFKESAPLLSNYDLGFRSGNKIHIVSAKNGEVFSYAGRYHRLFASIAALVVCIALWGVAFFLFWGIDVPYSKSKKVPLREVLGDICEIGMFALFIAAIFCIFVLKSLNFVLLALAIAWLFMIGESILKKEIYMRFGGKIRYDERPEAFTILLVVNCIIAVVFAGCVFMSFFGDWA